jgi:hypothetical protein
MDSTRCSCQFLLEVEISEQIFEKYSYQISRKSFHLEPSLFHTPTDITHLIVAMRNLGSVPKGTIP